MSRAAPQKWVCKPPAVWYTEKNKPRRLRAAGQEVLTMKGSAFRLAGLILGIVASVAAVVAIVLSAVGMSKARQCKQCKLGGGVK